MKINDILLKAHITEKSMRETALNTYCFEVNIKATKNQIRSSVEKLFKVEVKSVRTYIKKGKIKRVGRKMRPKKRPDKKIAFVTLKKGKIDIFPVTK